MYALFLSVCIPWLFTLENVAEMKFLMRKIPLSWVPFYLYSCVNKPDNSFITASCEEMNSDLLRTSPQPILFKGCLGLSKNESSSTVRNIDELSVEQDFAIFNHTYQNLFLPCDAPKINKWQYKSLDDAVTDILEKGKPLVHNYHSFKY